jgi:ribosomal protein L28
MATKVCAISGKGRIAVRRIQHHHSTKWRFKAPVSLRVFKPNLKKIDLEVNGQILRTHVCMKCYKRLRKEQGK